MSHKQPAGKARPDYVIEDPKRLSDLLSQAAERYGGVLGAARHVAGDGHRWKDLSQSQEREVRRVQKRFQRLVRGETPNVTKETRLHLLHLFNAGECREVDSLLIPPHVQDRLARFDSWLQDQAWGGRRADWHEQTGKSISHLVGFATIRDFDGNNYGAEKGAIMGAVYELWKHLRAKYRSTVLRLEDAILAAGYGFHEPRARLAFHRILMPLLQYGQSGGVERHWRELSAKELGKYFRAAVTVETTLLRRGTDISRARQRSPEPLVYDGAQGARWHERPAATVPIT